MINQKRLLNTILLSSVLILFILLIYHYFFYNSTTSDSIKPKPKPITGLSYSSILDFSVLPNWGKDQHAEAWPALIKNCQVMAKKEVVWQTICTDAKQQTANQAITNAAAKQFFESHFTPYQLIAHKEGKEKKQGLMTGYYEPLLKGDYKKSDRYQYPIYAPPKAMLRIELGNLYPDLEGKRVRGRVEGNKIIPFYDRKTIDSAESPLKGEEIIWVDNRNDLFFLHIQGSGRVELPNGKVIGVGYADQNGQPYHSIGKILIEKEVIARKDMNLFSLKGWLRDNPDKALAILNANPSYIFFSLRDEVKEGPIGSLNVPLTPERSIAIDPKKVSLGSLMYVDTTYPDKAKRPLQKLVFAQDTGGAIKGELRADMFYGTGKQAEVSAGLMKNRSQYFILRPNEGKN
ncbi:MAG: murein transglycosylase A [Thiotrichaceae bacterium]|nr:murein transglycosylase A [Thiotrichaceae bacterium]